MTDITKPPGIAFLKVVLTKLHFAVKPEFKPEEGSEIAVNATPTYSFHISPDDSQLAAILDVRVDCPALELQVEICGHFSREGEPNLTLRDFAQVNAFAYLVPFAREIIFNTTARCKYSALVLPPMNVFAAVNEQKQRGDVVNKEKDRATED